MESYLENNENSFFFSFPILKKALRCLLSSLEYKSISLLTSFYWKMFKSLFSKRILSCLMFMGKKVFMKIQNKAFDDWLKLFKRFFFCFKKEKHSYFCLGKLYVHLLTQSLIILLKHAQLCSQLWGCFYAVKTLYNL